MKNLNKKLENYKIGSAMIFSLGCTIMGLGIYNSISKGQDNSVIVGMGGMLAVFSGGYYLGREHEKEINKKNYQTKPEDYQ